MTGRWPANVILSPAMAKVLDGQSGTLPPSRRTAKREYENNRQVYSPIGGIDEGQQWGYLDDGGASRFFLQAGYTPEELEWIYSVGLRPYGLEQQ